jgi:hypothetical protein
MLKTLFENFLSLFNVPHTPSQEYFFNKYYYHPIYGLPGKVDYPKINVKTWFGSEVPHITHLNGRLDQHFVGQPAYRDLWDQNKRFSWFDTDIKTQISGYAYRPIRGNIGYFLNGQELSSRDVQFDPSTTNPDHTPYRMSNFFQDAK